MKRFTSILFTFFIILGSIENLYANNFDTPAFVAPQGRISVSAYTTWFATLNAYLRVDLESSTLTPANYTLKVVGRTSGKTFTTQVNQSGNVTAQLDLGTNFYYDLTTQTSTSEIFDYYLYKTSSGMPATALGNVTITVDKIITAGKPDLRLRVVGSLVNTTKLLTQDPTYNAVKGCDNTLIFESPLAIIPDNTLN